MRIPVIVRIVALTGVAMLGAECSLRGQVPLGWAPLCTTQGVVPRVGAKVIPVSGGYQVFFKNFSASPVHFDFYLSGAQTIDAVPGNGRVHLKPGNPVGPIEVVVQPGSSGAPKLEALNASIGNED